MIKPDIIVVGASAGGVQALMELVGCLPLSFNGSVFIVLHIPAYSPSSLPEILSRCGSFKAIHPKDGEKIQEKMIYVAPPDHHLLIEDKKVLVKKGPKENRFRPSIDALFRSAAYSYGSRVIGIILSGVLDDGTSGMWTIKRLGGFTIVQDAHEAMHPQMPLNVQEHVDVDRCIPVAEMCKVIDQVKNEPASDKLPTEKIDMEMLEIEITIAKQDNAFSLGIINKGELTSFTCPECHGALVRLMEGNIIRFRCHTGHAFTASALLAGITKTIEEALWSSMRAVEECTLLLGKLKDDFTKIGNTKAASFFASAEKEQRARARIIHDSVFTQKILSADLRFDKDGENRDIDISGLSSKSNDYPKA